jgi:hypothetical protein
MSDVEISVEGSWTLTRCQVWPDRDGPENPTAADVIEVMKSCGSMSRVLRDWNLDEYEVTAITPGDVARWR